MNSQIRKYISESTITTSVKSTKIIATIGPACDTTKTIKEMRQAGMDVARLNFSHGSHEYFKKIIRNIKRADKNIAILLDTAGPEIRTGEVSNGAVELKQGSKIIYTKEKVISDGKMLTINYDKLLELEKGDQVALDDGSIETKIIKKDKECLIAEIIEAGTLGSNKGVSLPGHRIDLPILGKKDRLDITEFEHDVDFVAASFVRDKEDMNILRKFIHKSVKIIAKIEHWEAIDHLDDIIDSADGIMVARGDLGVEVTLEKVPKIQSDIIRRCNELGKPVIVATQMLESMRTNPRPTRAEVGDVATAILQGTDAVMLSGETTVGKYPVQAVRTMSRIAHEYDHRVIKKIELSENSIATYVAEAAYYASKKLHIKAILTPTESGFTARNVSRFKPKVPVFAMTPNRRVFKQLNLSWGVHPICISRSHKKLGHVINQMVSECIRRSLLSLEDTVVVTGGYKLRQAEGTNTLEINRVQDIITRKG